MSQTLILNQVFKDSDDFFTTITEMVMERIHLPIECVIDVDWDSDIARNIFFTDCNDNEYTIRLWNIHETDDHILVDFSLFYTLPDGSGEEVL